MDTVKVVIMAGPWTEWREELESVSPCVKAVAAHSDEDLLREIADADVVYGRLPRNPFLKAKRLRWVQSIGVGFETMLYPEMIRSDVVITNTAGAFDAAMAEQALAFMLAHARGLIHFERDRKNRVWDRHIGALSQIHGKTACVLGLGSIGRSIAVRLDALGLTVTAVDAQVATPPAGIGRLFRPDRLLAAIADADYVVVALPLTANTNGIIDAACFSRMKETAFLVNVARGPIVNETDLVRALQEKRIAGAGLDVFAEEPLPDSSPLWDMPNVVFAPHSAGYSPEGRGNILRIFRENLRRFLAEEPLMNVVDKEKGYLIQTV